MNIILLSGGSGKRLWPLSNDIRSKQFIKIFRRPDAGEDTPEDEAYESMVQRVYRQIHTVDPDAGELKPFNTPELLALTSSWFWCKNISITTDNATKLERYCEAFTKHLPMLTNEQEPKFNIVAWTDEPDTDPIVTIMPRERHRASNYGPGKGHYLVSPGVIDMAGLMTFIDEAQFQRIAWDGVLRLLREVSADDIDYALYQFRKTKL